MKPYIIKEIAGVKVGIIGLTTQVFQSGMGQRLLN